MSRGKRYLAAIGALGFCGSLALASPAFAAGTGYTPAGATPAAGGTASGLAGTVLTSTAIQPTGGTASATLGSESISVSVPSGAFTGTTQAIVTDATSAAASPSSGSAVLTFGVGFYVNGTKVTGSFPAVTVTVTGPGIVAGSTVYIVTGTGLVAASGAQVTAGSATFTITSDPVIEIVAPAGATSSAIPGGASAQTGKPVILEMGASIILVFLGLSLLIATRLRRRVV